MIYTRAGVGAGRGRRRTGGGDAPCENNTQSPPRSAVVTVAGGRDGGALHDWILWCVRVHACGSHDDRRLSITRAVHSTNLVTRPRHAVQPR